MAAGIVWCGYVYSIGGWDGEVGVCVSCVVPQLLYSSFFLKFENIGQAHL